MSLASTLQAAPCCTTCLYFRHVEKGSGNCHRYPPSFAGEASPRENHHWKFPVVGGHGWCGEYRAQKSGAPA